MKMSAFRFTFSVFRTINVLVDLQTANIKNGTKARIFIQFLPYQERQETIHLFIFLVGGIFFTYEINFYFIFAIINTQIGCLVHMNHERKGTTHVWFSQNKFAVLQYYDMSITIF